MDASANPNATTPPPGGGRVTRRDKSTKRSVLLGDRLAGVTITVGGLMVIVAVVAIVVFLVRVALPLAGGVGDLDQRLVELEPKRSAWVNADEHVTVAARVASDGSISGFHVPTGEPLFTRRFDFGDGIEATAAAGVLRRDSVLFGFEDGSVRFGSVAFRITTVTRAALPGVGYRRLSDTDLVAADGVVFTKLRENQFRRVELVTELGEAEQISEFPVIAADYRVGGTAERPTRSFVTFDTAGIGRISRAEVTRNLLTNEESIRLRTATLPTLPEGTVVTAVAMTSQADAIYVAAADGTIHRFDSRNFNAPVLAESRRVFDDGVDVTTMRFLNGELALAVGGANGAVDVFFRLQPEGAQTADGFEMVRARSHEPHGAPVVDIDVSQRSKSIITQDADGNVWVRHSTADSVLARLERQGDRGGHSQLMMLPRADGALVVGENGQIDVYRFSFKHPAASFRTIFGRVWYEGYAEPTWTWQSSGGTDIFEPKYSLVPLIFGTFKATFYALLFAIPVALLGAMYTSEFVHRRVRAGIKPMMEMMESLPTVVLGFVGALILAPLVETWIAAVMLGFVALPMGLMIAAFAWQLLPTHVALKLEGIPKLFFILGVIVLSLYGAYRIGPTFERLFFYGDFKAWTGGDVGTGQPFLLLVLFPLSFLLISWGFTRGWGHHYRMLLRDRGRAGAARIDLGRWLAMLGAAGLLSWTVSGLLTALGFDPRGGFVDSYSQRNALVVGFVMGFAIIPNIYTLAEDAMNAVPAHLRAASLAAGATPWQTALWVIIPTAASGIFAAVMIGMGRAVGETMIVVMAAGNTPVLDMNIFSGLRTLSANIAVELPEAVKDGTLYRMLFLAAVTLFGMTFVINTIAEIIRQRFRKRAFQL